jgi:hypothetical protein
MQKLFTRSFPVPETSRNLLDNFLRFSAQDRPRKLKIISLKLPDNEDSEYVFKIFPACMRSKQQHKTSGNTIFHGLVGWWCTVGQIGPQR